MQTVQMDSVVGMTGTYKDQSGPHLVQVMGYFLLAEFSEPFLVLMILSNGQLVQAGFHEVFLDIKN